VLKSLFSFSLFLGCIGTIQAQSYIFSDCKDSVTLTVTVNSQVSTSGPNPDGQGGHNTNLIFFGDFVLTIAGTTTTYSNVLATGSIGYTPNIGNLTTFLIQIAPGGPATLQATLQGAGDLIPSGSFSTPLPPLASWTAPNLGMQHDYIQFNGKFYLLDTFAACNAGGGGGGATPSVSLVISAGAFGGFSDIAPGTWIEIYGTSLAPDAREWGSADFNGSNAPTSLDGVQVTINGQKCFIRYISPGQINAQVPSNFAAGSFQLTVINNGISSKPYMVSMKTVEPGLLAPPLFKVGGNQYVTALLPDNVTYVAPPGSIAGVTSRRVAPGETIVLYGIGFGLVIPPSPAGIIAPAGTKVILPLQISFGQTPAQLSFYGLATGFVGLYQFNVVVPAVPDNDLVPVTVSLAGNPGAQTLYTAVHK